MNTKLVMLSGAAVLLSLCSIAQSGKSEISLSEPFQIDSSEYYIFPRFVDDYNRDAYGSGKGYLPGQDYSEIFFYNSRTKETKKLFDDVVLIQSFNPQRYYGYYDERKTEEPPANILPNHIIYLARTDNYNGDKGLDSKDPVYLYISTKAGTDLKRITPVDFNVTHWFTSKDKKIIFVKLQEDTNKNKKFGQGDDDVYYRIDLDNDVSKIKCYPVAL